jgi:hypothetical protein
VYKLIIWPRHLTYSCSMQWTNLIIKKAVLGIVKAFVEEEEYPVYDRWKDKKFVSELVQEYNDDKSGKIKGASIEEVERKARENARKQRQKKAS